MEDSITRENRLNLLLSVLTKVHNEGVDILYAQNAGAQEKREKYNLIYDLLLDDSRVIPAVILSEAESVS